MFIDAALPSGILDVPTLSFVAVCIAALLGLLLTFVWLQHRGVRALAWWGAAYMIGASAMALWSAPNQLVAVPPELSGALTFLACGMIWHGVRLFQGRHPGSFAAFAGAIVWVGLLQFPLFAEGNSARIALGAVIVSTYTFAIAYELGRERRRSLFSITKAILVPCLHAGIFLLPLGMRAFLPEVLSAGWLTVFTLEAIVYAVGTAFIMLVMVQDREVLFYRTAAETDYLTRLPNRRAFREEGQKLLRRQAECRGPASLLMFDLDHFKAINDRFGHALGDEVLRVFAQVARTSMRASDIVARVGGEEFAAILPASLETTVMVADRVRAGFERAGAIVGGRSIDATVSVGAASMSDLPAAPVSANQGTQSDDPFGARVDTLMQCADKALYFAKEAGRNRVHAAESGWAETVEPLVEVVVAAKRRAESSASAGGRRRKPADKRAPRQVMLQRERTG